MYLIDILTSHSVSVSSLCLYRFYGWNHFEEETMANIYSGREVCKHIPFLYAPNSREIACIHIKVYYIQASRVSIHCMPVTLRYHCSDNLPISPWTEIVSSTTWEGCRTISYRDAFRLHPGMVLKRMEARQGFITPIYWNQSWRSTTRIRFQYWLISFYPN